MYYRLCWFPLIHFIATAAIDSRGKNRSYTNNLSSGKNWFNDNLLWPQSMGKKAEVHYEEKKTHSIKANSHLHHSKLASLKCHLQKSTHHIPIMHCRCHYNIFLNVLHYLKAVGLRRSNSSCTVRRSLLDSCTEQNHIFLIKWND